MYIHMLLNILMNNMKHIMHILSRMSRIATCHEHETQHRFLDEADKVHHATKDDDDNFEENTPEPTCRAQ